MSVFVNRDYDVTFLPFRFWVGFWVFVILLIFVAFDLSFLVSYITRFTEEAFACLISVIFIYEAIANLFKIFDSNPIFMDKLLYNRSYGCLCAPPEPINGSWLGLTTAVSVDVTTASDDVNGTTPMIVYELWNWTQRVSEQCVTYKGHVIVETGCVNVTDCLKHGWTLIGQA